MDRAEAESRIRSLGPWFHQIEILPGLWTRDVSPMPGPQPRNHPHDRWEAFARHLPADMTGMRVLDAGCADGYFAIEVAKRGANVLAVDAAGKMIERLRWAAKTLGLSKLDARVGRLEDLPTKERFDTVLCLALLYHLKHPFLGLEILAKVTDSLYLETTTHPGSEPFLWLKPPQPGAHDQPKWFPTVSCVEEMLRWAGFREIERLEYGAQDRAGFVARR
jgi:tRNA (mo5U34)-methyltransferase